MRSSSARYRPRIVAGAAVFTAAACFSGRGAPPPAPPSVSTSAQASEAARATAAAAAESASARAATPPRPDPFKGADLSPKPPVLPNSPSDEQRKFLLQPGYHLEAVLTEPAIQQPAAISFDDEGRMYVLELRSYMLDADARDQLAPVNRISRWEDRDGDGVYERHTVFLDSLVFPRFAMPYGKNAILSMESNSNDVYKYTDTDGDGKADKKELFTTNFGRLANVEHLQSSLTWAMDNWLYSTVNAFRVRETPAGVVREPTGFNGAQWGASQDDDGKMWFQGGASGVPSYFTLPIAYGAFNDSLKYADDFDEIFGAPIHLADTQGGMSIVRMPDGSLARATAGSGSNVYRGGRLPAELIGDYFYGEVVGRVVRRVHPTNVEGLTRIANVYQNEKSEFIRSSDPLFRPIEIKTAPDGSMYIVDMYHGVIQESQWTPKGSYLRAKVEQYKLDKIVGLGRIWRLTYDGMPRDKTRPHMSTERPAALLKHLRHPNGWWRDMAQQELVLRKDRSVVPALRAMVRRDTMLVARFHALWTLEGLGALDSALVRQQMRDPSARMRVQAIRASETLYKGGDTTFAADYRKLTRDASVDVVIQAMMTMNVLHVPDAPAVIRAVMASNSARGVQLVGAQMLEAPIGSDAPRFASDEQKAVFRKGAEIFRETCAQCHGANGLGVAAGAPGQTVAPVLAGNPRVTGHADYVSNVLLHGLTGPIEGKSYVGQIMVSQAQQPDEWIAAVASYVRNAFTNSAGFVTPAQIAAVRARTASRNTAWTYPELAATVPVSMHQTSAWKATASHEADRAVRAFGTAGWNSGVPQTAGMWFQFELPEPHKLTEIQFQSGTYAGPGTQPRPVLYPRGYKVQTSLDGSTWSAPVSEGAGSGPSMTIAFPPVSARYVRITQTADVKDAPNWGMQLLQLWEVRGGGG